MVPSIKQTRMMMQQQHLLRKHFFSVRSFQRSFHLRISPIVKQALAEGKPIVALESTIISHGMPYPKNVEVAKRIEKAVLDNGAIPATIAVLDGIPHIGLDDKQLEILANKDGTVSKASTRDLGIVCAQKRHAATTVASTMKLASLAGIHVFATGGIGGVHRGGEISMDVSADLIELGKTPVTVVCAGIKSILDIKRSLEVLETQEVPVVGYNTDQFPAFFTRSSGCRAPLTAKHPSEIANMIKIHQQLHINSGIVVAVPNPQPLEETFIDNVIQSALLEAERLQIEGPKVTPFLLSRIEKLSEGRSLESNIALVLNNAKIAAEIAKSYASSKNIIIEPQHNQQPISHEPVVKTIVEPSSNVNPTPSAPTTAASTSNAKSLSAPGAVQRDHNDVLVVGGAVLDIIGNVTSEMTIPNTSNPGIVNTSYGGVGRNISEQLSKLGIQVALSTAVGEDDSGKSLLKSCHRLSFDTSMTIQTKQQNTARYNAIHDKNGELIIGIADMNIFLLLDPTYIETLRKKIETSKIVICDGNISKESFQYLANLCEELQKPLFFEPTSDHKCLLPFHAKSINKISMMKPNLTELITMVHHCLQQNLISSGKAMVSNIISNIVANRMDQKTLDSIHRIDLSDVRILASTMLRLMYGNQKFKFANPLLKSNSIFVADHNPTGSSASSSSTSPSTPLIHGKHLFVSLGKRGVLWCCPARLLSPEDRALLNQISPNNVVISGDDDYPAMTCHIPVEEIPLNEIRYGANGAGDAFCAGLLYGVMQSSGVLNQSPSFSSSSSVPSTNGKAKTHLQSPTFPNYSNVKMGLLNARNWITRK